MALVALKSMLSVLALSPTAIAVVGASSSIETFEKILVLEERLSVVKTLEDVARKSLCGAACSAMGRIQCHGFRFNYSSPGTCQLGVYVVDTTSSVAYDPGPVPTYFKGRYSSDRCYRGYLGMANNLQVEEFCVRMGGRIPEVRSQADRDSLVQANSGTPLGLREGDDGVWRWMSDGAVESDPEPGGDGSLKCARFATYRSPEISRAACTGRIGFACQFC